MILLQTLKLRNFKGIEYFEFRTNGGNVDIFGENGTGKTSIYDGFLWLFFDKDSQNRKDFAIKTLDQDGNELHGLEHEVEGTLSINGRCITLRKVFYEVYTQKRGNAQKNFTGHTTDYYIDGVNAKKSEYNKTIDSIINEDIFRLLTSPTYFNEILPWKVRREMLMKICGDIPDTEVIASNKKLADLPGILNGRSIDDHRKVIAARCSEINKELEKIPVRVNEANRLMPKIPEESAEVIAEQINNLQIDIAAIEQQIVQAKSGGRVIELRNQLLKLQGRKIEIQNNYQNSLQAQMEPVRKIINELKIAIENKEGLVAGRERLIRRNSDALAENQKDSEALRKRWYEVNGREFKFEQAETCPTCGQPIPEYQLEEAWEKALAAFNKAKSDELERINASGKKAKDTATELEVEIAQCEKDIAEFKNEIADLTNRKAERSKEIDEIAIVPFTDNPDYKAAVAEIETLEAEIAAMVNDNTRATSELEEKLTDLRTAEADAKEKLARFEQAKTINDRITELEEQEKMLATEFEKLQAELNLTEQFIKCKVNLLESRINSKFKLARFKLFETQINGGLNEICETLYNGVPYSGGLNNAARINVGLDIINTLAKHYGTSAPIFIDNREAITKLIDTEAQIISLIVSEKDKALRVETENDTEVTLFKEVV